MSQNQTPRLTFQGIAKSFFKVPVLTDISFEVPPGQVLGLVGENGAGKSTLMNILGGVLTADSGSMLLDGQPYAPANPIDAGGAGVVFVHQELNLFPNLSIQDNLFITGFPKSWLPGFLSSTKARRRAKELLARVGLERDPRTTVDVLSPGERQQLEIAKSLAGHPKVVIFDEPTTSLTAPEIERLFALIRELVAEGASVIYISHILGDVLELCDQVVVLRDGSLVDAGPRQEFTVNRMISRMVGRDLDRLYPEKKAVPTDEVVLDVQGLGEPGTIEDVSFQVRAGEVVGVFGLMGAGRSEMARIVFGLDPHHVGSVRVKGQLRPRISPRSQINAGMGFVTEDRRNEGLLMDTSVVGNIGLAVLTRFANQLGLVRQSALRSAALDAGQRLNLKSNRPDRQPVRALSGGNQQKAVIAKWLLIEPEVLILDEPTRGIDVGAKHEVYAVIDELAQQRTGVLLISSELPELLGTCDRILVMRRGEIEAEFTAGEFDEERILAAAFGQTAAAAATPEAGTGEVN
ncbi:MAG: sugar ABC transporter ATP-binding protein [Propionicimonas sp.]